MGTGSLDELIARCIRDLEANGLVVPDPHGVMIPDPPGPAALSPDGSAAAGRDGRGAGDGRGASKDQAGRLVIPVGVSNRHVHLCEKDFAALFGAEAARTGLSRLRDLSQPGQFVANEVVSLVGPKGSIPSVRVLGPLRARTQVEVSRTDAYTLGISPPVRDSGDLDGSAPIAIVGPCGLVSLKEGAIIAVRHIHMTPEEASRWGLRDKDRVEVEVPGDRGLVFGRVLVRVDKSFRLEMHVDTDEANAALLRNGDLVEVVGSTGTRR